MVFQFSLYHLRSSHWLAGQFACSRRGSVMSSKVLMINLDPPAEIHISFVASSGTVASYCD